MDENTIWEIRAFVYQYFAEMTRPPDAKEAALHFGMAQGEAAFAYEELQRRHAIFLKPGTYDIQMAWPFSAEETPFQVRANNRTYFANCAWDSFGIPAALQADADIEAVCAQSGEPIRLSVTGGQIYGPATLVHLLVPFRDWYSDLPST
jgi:hypothetical protein